MHGADAARGARARGATTRTRSSPSASGSMPLATPIRSAACRRADSAARNAVERLEGDAELHRRGRADRLSSLERAGGDQHPVGADAEAPRRAPRRRRASPAGSSRAQAVEFRGSVRRRADRPRAGCAHHGRLRRRHGPPQNAARRTARSARMRASASAPPRFALQLTSADSQRRLCNIVASGECARSGLGRPQRHFGAWLHPALGAEKAGPMASLHVVFSMAPAAHHRGGDRALVRLDQHDVWLQPQPLAEAHTGCACCSPFVAIIVIMAMIWSMGR